MTKVSDTGFRHDIAAFFEKSGVRDIAKLTHNPFIVLLDRIEICDNARDLMDKYPPETEVIAQWPGKWSSHFFHFTVQDLISHVTAHPKDGIQIV